MRCPFIRIRYIWCRRQTSSHFPLVVRWTDSRSGWCCRPLYYISALRTPRDIQVNIVIYMILDTMSNQWYQMKHKNTEKVIFHLKTFKKSSNIQTYG